jgi:hypothetical protein
MRLDPRLAREGQDLRFCCCEFSWFDGRLLLAGHFNVSTIQYSNYSSRLHYSIVLHQNNNYFRIIFVIGIIPAQLPEGE